jgi:Flp pilus assembly protein TadG
MGNQSRLGTDLDGPRVAGGTGIGRLLSRFRRDRRGGTAVQAIVMLPVIIIAFMGLVEVWQVIQIRDSLHTGTYQAMRFLSLYPPETTSVYVWEQIAEKYVHENLRNNPWVDPATVISGGPNSMVKVVLETGDYNCTDKFTVRANYAWTVMGGDIGPGGFPNPLQLNMQDERQGEVLCR